MKGTGGGGGKGHTSKHSGTHKHHAHGAKHHPKRHLAQHGHTGGKTVHVKAHHAKHPRGLAVGDLLAVCSFEAVAASLRVLGQRVSDDDMLALWDLCGQREVSIAEALAAAAEYGLAGCRPQWCTTSDHPLQTTVVRTTTTDQKIAVARGLMPVILGVDLPGPHAVLATPDGWWSWGELYDPSYFPHARIEEAWVIAWQ